MDAARSVCASSVMFLASSLSVSDFSNSQVFELVRYGAKCTDVWYGLRSWRNVSQY